MLSSPVVPRSAAGRVPEDHSVRCETLPSRLFQYCAFLENSLSASIDSALPRNVQPRGGFHAALGSVIKALSSPSYYPETSHNDRRFLSFPFH